MEEVCEAAYQIIEIHDAIRTAGAYLVADVLDGRHVLMEVESVHQDRLEHARFPVVRRRSEVYAFEI